MLGPLSGTGPLDFVITLPAAASAAAAAAATNTEEIGEEEEEEEEDDALDILGRVASRLFERTRAKIGASTKGHVRGTL